MQPSLLSQELRILTDLSCNFCKIIHDSRGNRYFPGISYDQIDKVRGMDIIICTTANTDEEARELLTLMGAPFAK